MLLGCFWRLYGVVVGCLDEGYAPASMTVCVLCNTCTTVLHVVDDYKACAIQFLGQTMASKGKHA